LVAICEIGFGVGDAGELLNMELSAKIIVVAP
jgi:hypothetical protein